MTELYDVYDGTLYGRGDTRQDAICDAIRSAYFGTRKDHLIRREEIATELHRCKETGGALGFDFREDQ